MLLTLSEILLPTLSQAPKGVSDVWRTVIAAGPEPAVSMRHRSPPSSGLEWTGVSGRALHKTKEMQAT